MSLVEDFKKFALRGNLVDLAIGFTVGAAFTTVAKSIVNDIIMPPIGLMIGAVEFEDLFWLLKDGPKSPAPYATLADAQAAGAVTMNWGIFVNNLLALLLVALVMFFIIRAIKRAEQTLEDGFGEPKPEPNEPQSKKCPHCRSTIPYRATKCAHCTADLEPVAESKHSEPV